MKLERIHADAGSGSSEALSLDTIRDAVAAVAGRLDSRFVEAGNGLASAYEIVEALVGSLDSVTGALDGEGGAAAVADMRAVADRLESLPELQAQRRTALATIGRSSLVLHGHAAQVRRTLAFLRIAGLNLKVAAAGAAEFSGFADAMVERLDESEEQMRQFGREVDALGGDIGGISASEASLAAECAKVIPAVPRRLAADALVLQRHQEALAELAGRSAEVARRIRGAVGTALGAIQIGDITRQRLEHVCQGIELLGEALSDDEQGGVGDRAALGGHVLALLAAQAANALAEFDRESRLLVESLEAIGPDAGALLALRQAGPSEGGADRESSLRGLEQSIADVHEVTRRLHEADSRSDRLSSATSATAESLTQRLKMVQKVKNDVQQMAWNTDFRCHRMGDEGRALRMVAAEIRTFANKLEGLTREMAETFDGLAGAASSMRGLARGDAGGAPGDGLAASLACVRQGAARMDQGMAGLDGSAAAVADILERTTRGIDCRADVALLDEACRDLAAFGAQAPAAPEGAQEILDRIAATYTMASEREIHRLFTGATTAAAEEGDDGLFGFGEDEDDFDDGLF